MSNVHTVDEAAVRAWMDAYRVAWIDRDPDRIVQLFTRDAHYRERRFRPPAAGIEAIRSYWTVVVKQSQRDIDFNYDILALRDRVAYVHWQAHFTWLPINGIMELDAVSRIGFSDERGSAGLVASQWDEWIEIREA